MDFDEFAKKIIKLSDRLMDNNKRLTEENVRLRKQIDKPKIDWKLIAGISYAVSLSAMFIYELDN